ncbi:MAG: MOSC domain-containing protein [Hyphomicrobium sp.]
MTGDIHTERARIAALYRYPVKGLTPQPLARVTLNAGEPMPFDRAWAIENGPGRFDASAPRHLPKVNFLMLMRDERLAKLDCRFDDATTTLRIERDGKPVVSGNLSTLTGRSLIEQFMAAFMQGHLRGPPRIVEAPGHSFSDVAAKCLHIVNMASVRDLERAVGSRIDPLRFRPNVIIEGLPAWREFAWVGQHIEFGNVRLTGLKRTERCAATNVDPATGVRDMDLPAQLARRWGHTDFGIYAAVTAGAELHVGDAVQPVT